MPPPVKRPLPLVKETVCVMLLMGRGNTDIVNKTETDDIMQLKL